jgi:hypothetical protein
MVPFSAKLNTPTAPEVDVGVKASLDEEVIIKSSKSGGDERDFMPLTFKAHPFSIHLVGYWVG